MPQVNESPAVESNVAAPVAPATPAPVAATAPAKAATNGSPKKAAKKATPKASAKKAPVKKAAKAPAAAQKGKSIDRGINKTQISVLKLLAKGTPLTRSKISERLDGAFIGGRIMGHADPKKLKKSSLVGRGFARFAAKQKDDDREDTCYYEITAAGRKALESAK